MAKDVKSSGKAEEGRKNAAPHLKEKTPKGLKSRAIPEDTGLQRPLEKLGDRYPGKRRETG